MRAIESAGDVPEPLQRSRDGNLGAFGRRPAQNLVEPPSGDIFHGEPPDSLILSASIDGDDGGIAQLGDGLHLAIEAHLGLEGAHALRPDHLEGHPAVQRLLNGEVDDSHAALAETAYQPEFAEPFVGQVGLGLQVLCGAVRRPRSHECRPGGLVEKIRLLVEGGDEGLHLGFQFLVPLAGVLEKPAAFAGRPFHGLMEERLDHLGAVIGHGP